MTRSVFESFHSTLEAEGEVAVYFAPAGPICIKASTLKDNGDHYLQETVDVKIPKDDVAFYRLPYKEWAGYPNNVKLALGNLEIKSKEETSPGMFAAGKNISVTLNGKPVGAHHVSVDVDVRDVVKAKIGFYPQFNQG